MQAVKVIWIAAAVVAALLSLGLAAIGTAAAAVAITHAGEDTRNRERWNDNDDRKAARHNDAKA